MSPLHTPDGCTLHRLLPVPVLTHTPLLACKPCPFPSPLTSDPFFPLHPQIHLSSLTLHTTVVHSFLLLVCLFTTAVELSSTLHQQSVFVAVLSQTLRIRPFKYSPFHPRTVYVPPLRARHGVSRPHPVITVNVWWSRRRRLTWIYGTLWACYEDCIKLQHTGSVKSRITVISQQWL